MIAKTKPEKYQTKTDNLPRASFKGSRWCPFANCNHASIGCNPCQQRFLFEIATGKSGSTSVMSMLSALPGMRMAGENNDFLSNLRKAFNQTFNSPWKASQRNTKAKLTPWMHWPVVMSDIACVYQDSLNFIIPPRIAPTSQQELDHDKNTIIGFKEIRFLRDESEEGLVKFINDNFPCSRIVFNYAVDLERQSQSGFWSERAGNKSVASLDNQNQKILNLHKLFGTQQSFLLERGVWSDPDHGIDQFNHLLAWLGYQDCSYTRLGAVNLKSRGKKSRGKEVLPEVTGSCTLES
jgi:hypothetical protein